VRRGHGGALPVTLAASIPPPLPTTLDPIVARRSIRGGGGTTKHQRLDLLEGWWLGGSLKVEKTSLLPPLCPHVLAA